MRIKGFLLVLAVCAVTAAYVLLTKKTETKIAKKTICLNMIVKNERDVIERCLQSVLPIIDCWVIVDTGSTDGTQEIIKNYMLAHNVPGTLYERPWKNFSHNRNEAMALAQKSSDYLLFIDADEYLVYEPGFTLPPLDKDYYWMTNLVSGATFGKIQLIRCAPDWEYVGVLHEVLDPKDKSYGTLEKVHNIYTTDGARSKDPQKYLKDAAILQEALLEEPDNARYQFYLAQSYANAHDWDAALKAYEKRAEMIGSFEETYWSLLKIANIKDDQERPAEEVLESYMKALRYNPSRIEPYYHMAAYCRTHDMFQRGYDTAKIARTLPVSTQKLFVQEWMNRYGVLFELSICVYWLGKYEECQLLCLELLKQDDLPEVYRDFTQKNLGFANERLLDRAFSPN